VKLSERWRRRIVSSTIAAGLAVIAAGPVSMPPVYAAANLVKNSGFEKGTSGWNSSNKGVVVTRSTNHHTGHFAGGLVNQNSAPTQCTLNDSPDWSGVTIASNYTATAWVKGWVGEKVEIRVREYAQGKHGAFKGQSIAIYTLKTTAWTKLSVSYTPKDPKRSVLDFTVYSRRSSTGACFVVDDLSLRSGA
jgi:Carbohydrate binding domain